MLGENMKKIIYSIYFPIEKHVPFKGTTEKSENRTKELNRNANELIYRQRIYAMSIGAEYRLFGKTDFDEFKEMTTEYDFDKLGFSDEDNEVLENRLMAKKYFNTIAVYEFWGGIVAKGCSGPCHC